MQHVVARHSEAGEAKFRTEKAIYRYVCKC